MAINLKDTVQIIRGKKTDIAARTGANGELNWADDTYELYIHDGKTRGGHLIGKASGTAGVVGGAGIAVSTSDGISTVSIKRDPANVLYATTDGAGVRIGTSGALQITAQNALDLRVAKGGGIIVDSNGVKIDSAVLSSVFRYAGQVNSVDDLPSDAQPGDVYDVKDSGVNYVWSGTSWDNLGGIMSVDSAPTQGSINPVASGGVYDAIQDVKLYGDGTTVTVANNIISVPEYEGATADTAATSGLVPPAAAGEQDKVLRGDGEWGEYLPLTGGTMEGNIDFNDEDGILRGRIHGVTDGINAYVHLTANQNGGYISVVDNSENSSERDRGSFVCGARNADGTVSKALRGRISGALIWDGKNIVRSVNGVNADASGNVDLSSTSGSMPVGSIYVQFPGQAAPSDLFGGTWSNVSSSYAGRFFRAEGGSAAAFGSAQNGGLPDHTHIVNIAWGNGGSSSTPMLRGEADNDNLAGYKTFESNGSNRNALYGAATEVRPVNQTIRIWKRTA